MPLEQQLTSRELSERLCKLGVPQNSLYYWVNWKSIASMGIGWQIRDAITAKHNYPQMIEEDYSAFTCSELGELVLDHPKYNYQTYFNKEKGYCFGTYNREHIFYADTLVEAMGEMLACLLEQGIITI